MRIGLRALALVALFTSLLPIFGARAQSLPHVFIALECRQSDDADERQPAIATAQFGGEPGDEAAYFSSERFDGCPLSEPHDRHGDHAHLDLWPPSPRHRGPVHPKPDPRTTMSAE